MADVISFDLQITSTGLKCPHYREKSVCLSA